jgi:hypothetical protein
LERPEGADNREQKEIGPESHEKVIHLEYRAIDSMGEGALKMTFVERTGRWILSELQAFQTRANHGRGA